VTQPTNIYAETAPSGLFDTFLLWLSSDRDLAVKRHDEIMRKMIKYFTRRAYSDPEELAAETRERVARIINSNREYPNHEALFYSVAQKVWHEAVRKPKPESLVLAADFGPLVDQETEHKELQARCLERCLAKLPASERDLISRYFLGRGVDQTKARKQLMTELDVSAGALRVRLHSIRNRLRRCVSACMAESQR
jgi:DNA-directed RNA polymerase specialized sigma24 family protein